MADFKIDREFKSLIPELSDDEITLLEESIQQEGVRDPLVVWSTGNGSDILVEGHHRFRLIRKLKVPRSKYKIIKKKFADREAVKQWIFDCALGQRNLSRFQKVSLLIQKMESTLRIEAKKNQGKRNDISQKSGKSKVIHTDKLIAKAGSVSTNTVERVRFLNKNAGKETLNKLREGNLSINEAYKVTRIQVYAEKQQQFAHDQTERESLKQTYTAHVGNNSVLFKEVADLYLKPKMRIADVTYGRGVFWRGIDTSKFKFHPSDIQTLEKHPYDLRNLPYKNNSFDAIAFDPPYAHTPGNLLVDDSYKNSATTARMYHKDIMRLYSDGIKEAKRVLKKGGLLMVKCQDEVESSVQRWSHIEIFNMAIKLGFTAKDLFVLVQSNNPIIQHKKQKHARKNHSYLWVFKL